MPGLPGLLGMLGMPGLLGMVGFTPTPAAAIVAVSFPSSPSQEYERGRTAFLRGEYERAVGILHPLVYPELRLDSENEVLQAHRMLGVSYLFMNKSAEARIEFRKLLELSPDYRFDPLLDPAQVVEFFNGVVREQREELGDIEARLKKREDQRNRHVGEILVRRVERRSYALNFLPFGAGQFQNQEPSKGWFFFATEAGLAAISVGTFAANFAIYGTSPYRSCRVPTKYDQTSMSQVCPPDQIDHSREDTSRNLTRVQVASGVAFFGVALWGIIDSLSHFRAEVPLGDTYVPAGRLPPSGEAGAWRLLPSLDATTRGAALAIDF